MRNSTNSKKTMPDCLLLPWSLKRKLYTLSAKDWDSIPEIGDYSLRNKKNKFYSFVPIPDTLLEKARLEKKHTNPKHPHGWMAAARLEEVAGKVQVAHQGVKAMPNFVKLWMEAAKLEQDDGNKSKVLRKGLEHIPDSKVLNKAKEKLPKEPAIWITSAKLEEANNGNTKMVGKILERGIRALQREGVEIDREMWMKEAEASERAGSVATCQAIIHNIIEFGVEEEDRKMTWVADAEERKK
ncbi:hypothetical protein RD792_007855 [Penstemon davidsonii]|uniref:Uncharacterized protein n=1 Tax=Penstemon davidsonii TaxID=160366 RepID=A0ABR0D7H8_9LAMI|nr:hypothetical protein RD792_007855 [Penstemon davidsonii]